MVDQRKISEMRNLGPVTEQDLKFVGVTTAQQVIDLGVEGTFLQIIRSRTMQGRSLKICNAIYLYAIYGAIHEMDWRKVPDAHKLDFKKLTADMRASGRLG